MTDVAPLVWSWQHCVVAYANHPFFASACILNCPYRWRIFLRKEIVTGLSWRVSCSLFFHYFDFPGTST